MRINKRKFILEGDWMAQSTRLKVKYDDLSDNDLYFAPGHENELIKRLSWKLKKSKDVIIAMLRANAKVVLQSQEL